MTLLRPDEQIEHLGSVGREVDRHRAGEDARSAGQRGARRRGRRALLAHALRLRRLPQRPARRPPSRSARRRVLQRRRHGAARRARLHPPGRPQEQHDHQRRREHLPERDREHARPLSRCQGRRAWSACRTRNGARPCTRSSCCTTARAPTEAEVLDWCRDKMAGYKRPRSVSLHGRVRDAAHGHRQDPAPRAARPVEQPGAEADSADGTQRASIVQAFEQAAEALGPVTVVVNNAGIAVTKPLLEK